MNRARITFATSALLSLLGTQAGLVDEVRAQNSVAVPPSAELNVTDNSPITCIKRRKPAAGHDGYVMHIRCSATVSANIEYVSPPGVHYRITAQITNRGFDKNDLPTVEATRNDKGIMSTGTGKVTVPVSSEYSVPIEPWKKESDYCQAGSYPASVGIDVTIPLNSNGESHYSDTRDVTVQVTCTGS